MTIKTEGIPRVQRIEGVVAVGRHTKDLREQELPACRKNTNQEVPCLCFPCVLSKARGSMPDMSQLPGKI